MVAHGTGSEVMQRIAAPMVGGMITAPLLSMLVIPAAYLLLRRRGCRADEGECRPGFPRRRRRLNERRAGSVGRAHPGRQRSASDQRLQPEARDARDLRQAFGELRRAVALDAPRELAR